MIYGQDIVGLIRDTDSLSITKSCPVNCGQGLPCGIAFLKLEQLGKSYS